MPRIDDVFDRFETLPTLEDLAESIDAQEDRVEIRATVLESIMDQLRTAREELNDYHIRDAEMEGGVSIPRERYLRFLGMEAENLALSQQVYELEQELTLYDEPPMNTIVQPPPDDSWMEDEDPKEDEIPDPFVFGGTQSTSTPDLRDFKITGDPTILGQAVVGNPRPLKWADTVNLTQEDIEEVAKEVMRRIKES